MSQDIFLESCSLNDSGESYNVKEKNMEKENKTILDEVEAEETTTEETVETTTGRPDEESAETSSKQDTDDELVEDLFEDEAEDSDTEFESIDVSVTNKSKKELEEERGVKKDADGRTLTISEVSIVPPKVFKIENGKRTRIKPRTTTSGNGKYYSTKLKVRFAEDNLVEYYPGINIWVNDGKLNTENVQLNSSRYDDNYLSGTKVAQIVRLALSKMYEEKNGEPIELEKKTINERETIVVKDDEKEKFFKFSKSVSDQEILDWMVGKQVEISTSKGTYEGNNWFRNDIANFA